MTEQYLPESEHQKWLHITGLAAACVGMLVGIMIGVSITKERRIENPKIETPKMECPKP